jgi:FtsP/CotA-like multicopper oxidase with cupredoxin domain
MGKRIFLAVLIVIAVAGSVLALTGCASPAGQKLTINATVTGGKTMQPPDLSAHQNDTVTINITSDTEGEVHLHGYDIQFQTKAGQVVSQTFKADKTGDFPIEWESTATPLGHLVVT